MPDFDAVVAAQPQVGCIGFTHFGRRLAFAKRFNFLCQYVKTCQFIRIGEIQIHLFGAASGFSREVFRIEPKADMRGCRHAFIRCIAVRIVPEFAFVKDRKFRAVRCMIHRKQRAVFIRDKTAREEFLLRFAQRVAFAVRLHAAHGKTVDICIIFGILRILAIDTAVLL